jgi:hypothetical protein
MLATEFSSSTDMNGKVVILRFVKIVMLALRVAADLVAVVDSVHVEASAAAAVDSEAVEVSEDLVEASAVEEDSVAVEASVVQLRLMPEVLLVAGSTPALQLSRKLPILSRTSRHPEENAAQ